MHSSVKRAQRRAHRPCMKLPDPFRVLRLPGGSMISARDPAHRLLGGPPVHLLAIGFPVHDAGRYRQVDEGIERGVDDPRAIRSLSRSACSAFFFSVMSRQPRQRR